MILELLILIFILWLATTPPRLPKKSYLEYNNKIQEKLDFIYANLQNLLLQDNLNLKFTLNPSDKQTYTENKSHIYLVLTKSNGQFYDDNTLIYAAIHELSHIICPSSNNEDPHTSIFETIQNHYLNLAKEYKLYNPNKPIDPDYPCQN